jgi:hypothetical protein
MEAEVNALMGVEDEAIWNRVGLFSSVDELRVVARGEIKKVTSAELTTEPTNATRGEPVSLPQKPIPLSLEGRFLAKKVFSVHYVGRQDTAGRFTHPRSSRGRVHRASGREGPFIESVETKQVKT